MRDSSYAIHCPSSTGKRENPVFCDFEDADYAEFFRTSVKIVEAVESGTLGAKEAARRIFKLADGYAFPVPIRKDALVRAHWVKEEDELTERGLGRVRRGFREREGHSKPCSLSFAISVL